MLSYLSLFLLIFDLAIPPVKFIGSAPFSLLISIFVLLSHKNRTGLLFELKNFSIQFFIFYFLFILFVFVRVLFSGELDYLLSIIKSFFIFISSLFYLMAFGCNRINDRLINIFFINGIICLVAGSIPIVLDVMYLFKNNVRDISIIPYRNAFLAGYGYFGIAAAYAVIILLCADKLIRDGFSLRFSIKFIIIMIAGVLAGRTAFVGIVFSFIYVTFKSIKYSMLSVLLISGLIAIVLSVNALSIYSGWMFEFISFNDGFISLSHTSSTDELKEMFFMPSNDITWLWGDGRYVDGEGYYMHTDSGYMRNLFFGGLPFVIFVIMYACLFAYKSKNIFFWFFILPLSFLLHYKGVFILNNPACVPIFTLLAFWLSHLDRLKGNLNRS
ncbi:hypothetical protein NMD75_12100 [Edwardsiella tarda]